MSINLKRRVPRHSYPKECESLTHLVQVQQSMLQTVDNRMSASIGASTGHS
jgi:hypothetical protein